jgi:hypothetical protein
MSIPGSRLGIPSAPGTSKHRRIPNMPITITVGAAGTATFTWPGVPADEMWTGAVSIPQAAPSSVLPILWSATDGGAPIGQWYNSQSSGPLQIRTQLQVTGSGIAAASLMATLQGIATDIASAPPWWPAPTPAPPPSAPRVIVSNNVALGAGVTVQIGTDQPVIVGTALEIFEASTAHQGAGSSVRLYMRWSVDGSFVNPIEYTFDLADIANMRGLILPHLAPFVRFLAISSGQEQISLTVVTGLPAIVRPPIVPQGVLSFNGGPFANGVTSFVLPPYVGPAMLSGEMVSAAQKFELYVTSTNYLNQFIGTTFTVDSTVDPNGVRLIPPTQIYLPPTINTLNVRNGNGAPAAGDFQLVTLGP